MSDVRLSHFPHMSQVGYNGSAANTWDDMQSGVSCLIRPGGSDPTWRTWDFGLGGAAFSVLGFAIGNYVDLWFQTSHSALLESEVKYHLHYTLPSDSAADKIAFEASVIAAPVNADFAAVAGSPFTGEATLDGTESAKHNILAIGTIPAVNTGVSTAYGIQLKRVAASSDDYAAEVYLLFSDGHYQRDMTGSVYEYSKG